MVDNRDAMQRLVDSMDPNAMQKLVKSINPNAMQSLVHQVHANALTSILGTGGSVQLHEGGTEFERVLAHFELYCTFEETNLDDINGINGGLDLLTPDQLRQLVSHEYIKECPAFGKMLQAKLKEKIGPSPAISKPDGKPVVQPVLGQTPA